MIDQINKTLAKIDPQVSKNSKDSISPKLEKSSVIPTPAAAITVLLLRSVVVGGRCLHDSVPAGATCPAGRPGAPSALASVQKTRERSRRSGTAAPPSLGRGPRT